MGRLARSRHHQKTNGHKSSKRKVFEKRDLDQIAEDIKKKRFPPKKHPDDQRNGICN
jgi:hypothetical protein